MSFRDLLVLAVGVIGVIALGPHMPLASLVIALVVGHFFLFCNVFRIPRALELIWAAAFVALIAARIEVGSPSWPFALIAIAVVTSLVITLEMRRPSYHGVGWRRINPELRTWWDRQTAQSQALRKRS